MEISFLIWLLISTILIFTIIIILSFRFKEIASLSKAKISLLNAILTFFISQTTSYISSIGGTLITKSILIKRFANISLKKAALIITLEQIFDLLWQFILLLILSTFFVDSFIIKKKSFSIYIIVFVSTLIISLVIFFYFKKVTEILWKILPKKIKIRLFNNEKEKYYSNIERIKKIIKNKKKLIKISIWTILDILVSPLVIITLLYCFNISLNYWQCFIIYWLPMTVGRFSLMPAGFGTKDITMGVILLSYGIPPKESVLLVGLYRIIGVLINLLPTAVYLILKGKKIIIKKI